QGYIKLNKIRGSDLSLTLGRQEYEFGTGLILGNEDYYNGIVHDGIKGQWNFGSWDLTGLYFLTTERNDFANSAFTGFGSDDSDNPLDWNVEIAFQRGSASSDIDGDGENDRLHLSGNIVDASIGYNFGGGDSVHRVHVGFLRESGDDDVTDNDFNGWNRLFP